MFILVAFRNLYVVFDRDPRIFIAFLNTLYKSLVKAYEFNSIFSLVVRK